MIKYIPGDALILFNNNLSRKTARVHESLYSFNLESKEEDMVDVWFEPIERFDDISEQEAISLVIQEYGLPWRVKSDDVNVFSQDNDFWD